MPGRELRGSQQWEGFVSVTSDAVGTKSGSPVASGVTRERLANLRTWNFGLSVLHAV